MKHLLAAVLALALLPGTSHASPTLGKTTAATLGGTATGMVGGVVLGTFLWPAARGLAEPACTAEVCMEPGLDWVLDGALGGLSLGGALGASLFHHRVDAPGSRTVLLASTATALLGTTAVATEELHQVDALTATGLIVALAGTPTVAVVTARRQHAAAERRPPWDVTGIGPTFGEDGPGLELQGSW